MDHILEIVPKFDASDLDESVSARSIIGEPSSTEELIGLLQNADNLSKCAFLVCASDAIPSDEALHAMLATMGATDRNAVVMPRIVDADASSDASPIPFDTHTFALSGACALFAGEVYRRVGPFDSTIADIDEALAAYACKANEIGYTVAVSNGAIVRTDDARRARICASEAPKVIEKARYLDDLVPFVLSSGSRKPKVLFDFHTMPDYYCGTSEYQMALLEYFKEYFADTYEITVKCNEAAIEFHEIRRFGFAIMLPDEEGGLFDIGIVCTQPVEFEEQFYLNAHCVRYVYTMLDCILLRTKYLVETQPAVEDVCRCGLRGCDGIIAISGFSRDDYLDFFSSDPVIAAKRFEVVYIATDFGNSEAMDLSDVVPFEHYDLVIGNPYKHKALEPVLETIADSDRNYIFVGLPANVGLPSNAISFPPATLEEAFLDSLYERCDCVVFPSQYEGFGLPITIALKHGKKVVVCDNELNRELEDHFPDFRDDLLFFTSFEEIPDLCKRANGGFDTAKTFTNSWREAIVQIEGFLAALLNEPIDWVHIDQRQWQYRLLEEEMAAAAVQAQDRLGLKYMIWKRFLKDRPALGRLYRKFLMKNYESDEGGMG